MDAAERRRARRVPIEVPAAVVSATGPITAEMRDVSTGGAQLYVLTSSFGLSAQPTLLEAALAVRDALNARFTVMLAHDHVGEVHREAGLARLVLPSHLEGCIELGCEFDEPLSAEEMARLTSSMPEPASAEAEPASEPASQPAAPTVPEPEWEAEQVEAEPHAPVTQRYRVYLMGTHDDAAAPIVCRSSRLGKDGLRVRIPGSAMEAGDATEAAVTFMQLYGDRVKIKITEGPQHLWTGHAQVFGLEVKLARRDELLVSLGYTRTLRPAELTRMGIATRVA